MKTRITVCVDENLDLKLRERLREEVYIRNKSHLVEIALMEFLNKRLAK